MWDLREVVSFPRQVCERAFPVSHHTALHTPRARARARAQQRETAVTKSAPRPTLPSSSLPARRGVALPDHAPVDELVDEGLNKVRAPVLVVQVVRVLPDVHGEERDLARLQG